MDTSWIDNRSGSPEFLRALLRGAFTGSTHPLMPILLWYMPFTMFYGLCDLLFLQPLRCVVEIDAAGEGVFVKGERGKEFLDPIDTHADLAART